MHSTQMSKDILKKILKDQCHSSKAHKVHLDHLNFDDFLIIDVRNQILFETTPHIRGAINLCSLDELKAFCLIHQNEKILLTCNGGLQASEYGTLLVEAGFSNIYFLDEYLQMIEDYLPLESNVKEKKE